METARYDIKIRHGNSLARIFRFKDENGNYIGLAGKDVVFRVMNTLGLPMRKSISEGTLVLVSENEVRLDLTPLESRQFKVGRLSKFDIEIRDSTGEHSPVAGYMDVTEGANDDA